MPPDSFAAGQGAARSINSTDSDEAVTVVVTVDAELYQQRLEANECTYSTACRRSAADGTAYCPRHLKKTRKRVAARMEQIRDQREAAGLWRSCGHPKKLGQRCAVCAAKRPERIVDDAVTASVTAHQTDPFRRDSDGWKRYRGKGRRGAPGAAVNDEQDLHDATKALERGRQALAYARSPEVERLPRIQKRAVLNEALAHLGLAGRTLGEVTQRNQGRGPARAGVDDTAGATWDYAKPADAVEIAQARVGEYVYAPPVEPTGKKKDPGGRRTPPDLAPLRAALAARGLALAPEGAFYWVIVGQAGGSCRGEGATP